MEASGEGIAGSESGAGGAIRRARGQGLPFDLITLAVVTGIAFLVGSLVNELRVEPLTWKYRSREQILTAAVSGMQDTPGPSAGANPSRASAHEIRLEEFQAFVAEHRGLVLDARPAVFYREGHIPGALSLPRETFAEDYQRLRGQLEGDKDHPVAVYCSGADCPDSQLVADALAKLGYRNLAIYTSGWEEWSQTGLPQEGTSAPP